MHKGHIIYGQASSERNLQNGYLYVRRLESDAGRSRNVKRDDGNELAEHLRFGPGSECERSDDPDAQLGLILSHQPSSFDEGPAKGVSVHCRNSGAHGHAGGRQSPFMSAASSGQNRRSHDNQEDKPLPPHGRRPPGNPARRQLYFNLGFVVVIVLGGTILFFYG
jgi:hypothetical protein